MKLKDLVIVSPDAGGVERARIFSQKLKAGLAIADKRRAEANVAEIMHIIGDVKDKNVIIVDDIVDTAGTMTETAKSGDVVEVDYTGKFEDGEVFDSSKGREPLMFTLGSPAML